MFSPRKSWLMNVSFLTITNFIENSTNYATSQINFFCQKGIFIVKVNLISYSYKKQIVHKTDHFESFKRFSTYFRETVEFRQVFLAIYSLLTMLKTCFIKCYYVDCKKTFKKLLKTFKSGKNWRVIPLEVNFEKKMNTSHSIKSFWSLYLIETSLLICRANMFLGS